jgi:DivIVA domain-containing protein
MDLIKKVETTEFSQRLRGYDIDEVDAFHAELVREIAQLNRRITEAAERSNETEDAASARRPQERPLNDGRLHAPDGAIQRMLAIAQRTADEVMSEARDDADRLVGEAEVHASTVTSDADAYVAKVTAGADQQRRLIVTEAAAEARRLAEVARSELLAEINTLEGRRNALLADLDVLDTHIDDERSRIGAALNRMQEVLDHPSEFRTTESPELEAPLEPVAELEPDAAGEALDAERPHADADDDRWDGDDHGWDDDEADVSLAADSAPAPASARASVFEGDEDDVESVGGGMPVAEADPWGDDDWDDDDDAVDVVDVVDVDESPFDDGPGASVTDLASARNEVLRPAEEPLPSPRPVASPYPDDDTVGSARVLWDDEVSESDGPPTEAVLIDDLLRGDNADNDRFLDELRRATENEFGADDSDAAIAAFFDQDEDDQPAKRRGRKP